MLTDLLPSTVPAHACASTPDSTGMHAHTNGERTQMYLRCKHGRRALTVAGQCGPGGYFLIQTSQQVSAFTSQQCLVYVPRSPVRACGVPAYPAGRRGMPLKFQEFVKRDNGLQGMYSVGNRLFRPKNPAKC